MIKNELSRRIVSGAVFGIVMIGGILLSPYTYIGLMAVIMCLAMWEFFRLALGNEMKLVRITAIVTALTMLAKCTLWNVADLDSWVALRYITAGLLLLMPVLCIFSCKDNRISGFGYICAALLFIALPISYSPSLAYCGNGFSGKLLLSFFILIWASDIGAYTVGSLLGQRPGAKKLAPSISPKKSWWGFWGAIAFSVMSSIILQISGMLDFPIGHCILVSVLVAVTAVCGDLFESMWKRNLNVKDSGNIIPGHGGILDRFDSSLLAIPAGCLYLLIFNLI